MNATKAIPIIPRNCPDAAGRAARASLRKMRQAEIEGHERGRLDIHFTPANYRTREEWLAWLAGWRRGQAELKARHRGRGMVPL